MGRSYEGDIQKKGADRSAPQLATVVKSKGWIPAPDYSI